MVSRLGFERFRWLRLLPPYALTPKIDDLGSLRIAYCLPRSGAGMNFLEFCRSIGSPVVRAVALHWHEARGIKKMPSWQDLQPKTIAPYLELVWSYNFDAASGDFVGRLAGDRIARAYGKNFHGLKLADAYQSPDRYAATHALFLRVVSEPAIFRGSGRIFQRKEASETGERIMLPLSSNGVWGDGIFGATDLGSLQLIHQPVEAVHDIGDWFSLKD